MLTDDTLLRYARPGPRYTSYPTVPEWSDEPPDTWIEEGLDRVDGAVGVYVHIPFCREQCTFCGCNMVVSGLQRVGDRYLDVLEKQVHRLPLPARRLPAVRVHLGGGTPTWLSPEQLERLFNILERRFLFLPGAEVGVEVDPDVTTDAHLHTLARLGVSRLSIGVQSLDPDVLAAVNRPQQGERIAGLLQLARDLGMSGLNLDLMYGLPDQGADRFARTLDSVAELEPDRIALFGYAHVPWLKAHQRVLERGRLPSALERARLYLLGQDRLTAAGYRAIGLDHFARPHDALAMGLNDGTLRRDFMGYTDRPEAPLIGLGMSAISELPDRFLQQRSKLGAWYKAVERGLPQLERGRLLTDEDRLRAFVIERIMCTLSLRFSDIEERFGISAETHFREDLRQLDPLVADGLVELSDRGLTVPEQARILVRRVAQVFDAYLHRTDGTPRFSQAV